MSTQKRRIIYMDDAAWERLRALAAQEGATISDLIRRLVRKP